MNLKELLPTHFKDVQLDLPAYFITCRREIELFLPSPSPEKAAKVVAWEDALSQQPPDVIAAVRHRLKKETVPATRLTTTFYLKIRRQLGELRRSWQAHKFPPRPDKFANIMEALLWLEACDKMRYTTAPYGPDS